MCVCVCLLSTLYVCWLALYIEGCTGGIVHTHTSLLVGVAGCSMDYRAEKFLRSISECYVRRGSLAGATIFAKSSGPRDTCRASLLRYVRVINHVRSVTSLAELLLSTTPRAAQRWLQWMWNRRPFQRRLLSQKEKERLGGRSGLRCSLALRPTMEQLRSLQLV